MGILSSIGGAIKDVFSGIMSVFQPILEPIAKALDSDLGKAIMIGLSIFTLGTALVAAQAMYATTMAASQSFVQAFVAGGKQFLTTMMTGEGFTGTGPAPAPVAPTNAVADASSAALQTGGPPGLVGQTGEAAANMSGSMATGPGLTGDVMQSAVTTAPGAGPPTGGMPNLPPGGTEEAATSAELLKTAGGSGGPIDGTDGGSWLSKAKKAGKGMVEEGGFLRSEGGGQVVGSLISAAGNYYTEKDRQEFEDRIRRQWGNPNDKGIKSLRESEARVGRLEGPSAQGAGRASRATARNDPGATRPQFNMPINAGAGG